MSEPSGRLRVALVFGGRSGEHEVSVVSARSVLAALDPARFEAVPMAIDRSGRWADAATARRVLEASGDRSDRVEAFAGAARIDPRLADGSVDVVLPILHGPFGEDGTIQGLCEMLDLPYAGCGVAASALTMDKVLAKRLLVEAGLPTPAFAAVGAADWESNRASVTSACLNLPRPWFVKPARLGSSVGITKVKEDAGLPEAMATAFAYDDMAIVEEGIPAREIEVAVLDGDPPLPSVPGEVVPGHEFYDYADKYLDDACQLLAPAPLDETTAEKARSLSIAAFRALGCEGMARVDFLLDRRDGRLLIGELNAIPGFTSISMYPRLLALSGVPYPDVVARLIDMAIARHRRRSALANSNLWPLDVRAGGGRPGGGG
jgi:D-alanine-D-alanine ligase